MCLDFRLCNIFQTKKEMPAPPSGYGYGSHGPSCFDRVKTGFMLGFCVGVASGALFGGFSALRYAIFLLVLMCLDCTFNCHVPQFCVCSE